MEQFRFRKWDIYNDSQKLFSVVLTLVHTLPKEYRYSIGDQILRSSLSPVLNIAEGSGKSSIKELGRFLDIALGSLHETMACADVLARNKLISDLQQKAIDEQIESLCRRIGGFKKTLRG